MNLKDSRERKWRCADEELKFRICMEKSVVGIGWGLNADLSSWSDYRELADLYYKNDTGYTAAVNALQKISCGDLVWTQEPVKRAWYLAQVLDTEPSLCCSLRDFDLFSYRKARFYHIDRKQLDCYGLSKEKLSSRHTIERTGNQSLTDATVRLFASIEQNKS